MLSGLRNIAKTWFGKIIGIALIIGLAGFGISNVIFQFGTGTVARVGDQEISALDFQRAYNNQLNQLSQNLGQMLTNEQAAAFGLPGAVLQQLTGEAAINGFGEQLGLGVSEDRLARMLAADPSFAGTLGNFDRTVFIQVLRQSGYTQEDYYELQRKAARRQQIASGLFAGSPTPSAAVELLGRYSGDTRSVDYFVLNADALPPVADPTDEELQSYLEAQQTQFRTPEQRTVDLIVLSPETLAATITVGDDQIAEEYERTQERRVRVERRTIRQAPLNADQLATFEAGVAAATPLEQLVNATGVTFSDLGTLAQTEITDAALAEAAFGLPLDGYAVIPGIGGQRVVTVSAIEEGGQISLDDAREEIARQLALTQARNDLNDVLDQIEELRAAFRPLEEISERFGLPLETRTIAANGGALADVSGLSAVGDQSRVANAVFAGTQGDRAPAVTLGANRHAWFDLRAVEPARDQTLDEVRDALTAAWTAEATEEAVNAEVARILGDLDEGQSLADVAIALNQFPILSPAIRRDGTIEVGGGTTTDAVLTAAVAREIFAGGPDHFGAAVNSAGDRVIFQVVDVTPASDSAPAQVQQFAETSTRDSLYADFTAALRDTSQITINQPVLQQVLALDGTTP